ncbi:GNAT family N-acetyltransferase [Nonomuraea sp. NN258]|nr:GNAT family N-acetyltransferase [Nonomuraea antri]
MRHRPEALIVHGEISLRRWQRPEKDFDVLYRLIEESLDHLRPWMPWVTGHSPAATTGFLARCEPRWDSGEAYDYALMHRGAVVGCGSISTGDDPAGRELGYWLHPAATGRGVASRAATSMAEQALMLPDVAYVEIVHDVANTASGAVAGRAGFTQFDRRPAAPPLAPSDSGIELVWRRYGTPEPATTQR